MSLRVPLALVAILVSVILAPAVWGAGSFPEAVAWSPQGDGVPLDVAIRIEWSASMDTDSVEGAFSLTDGVTVWDGHLSFAWAHDMSGPFSSMGLPRFSLASETTYTARVDPTATDASGGFPLDQDGDGVGGEDEDALSWSFATEDATPPTVIQTFPTDGTAGVPVDTAISIAFSEPMDRESVESAFRIAPDGRGAFRWNGLWTEVTFDPSLHLRFETSYDVRVEGATARDLNGNLLDGDGDGTGGDDHVFAFETQADTEPPWVLEVSPGPDGTNVSVTSHVVVRFSEPMNRTSVEDAFSYSDGVRTYTKADGAFAWEGVTFPDDRVAFNPTANLPFLATIHVTLEADLARDPAGFLLDGNGDGVTDGSPEDDLVWSFTTEDADTTPPIVLAVDPPDGATDVPETSSIVLTFSEAMNRTSVEDAFSYSDGVRTYTKADGAFAWDLGDERFAYIPTDVLEWDRDHVIQLESAAMDVNGNGLAGDPFRSTFRTRPRPDMTPPRVISTDPSDGGAGVSLLPRISVTFDEPMDRGATEQAVLLQRMDDGHSISLGPFEWAGGGLTVAARPEAPLSWNTSYRVEVTQSARDEAGLPLEAPYTFTFRTVAWAGTVEGTVADDDGPVGDAVVRLGTRVTQTDASGTFAFAAVPEGEYVLEVEKPGYELGRQVVLVARGDADFRGVVDLGVIALRRTDDIPLLVSLAAVAGGVAILLFATWRRRRLLSDFEVPEDDFGAP